MDAETLRRVDRFWAIRLGCTDETFAMGGVQPVAGSGSLYLISTRSTLVVAGDPNVRSRLEPLLASAVLPDAEGVRRSLGARVDRIVGPAFLGYRATAPALTESAGEARSIERADRSALARLRDAASEQDWEHAALHPEHEDATIVGVFDGETLLAAAGFEVQHGVVAHIGVLAHPRSRGRGAGRRAVALAAQRAAERGLLLQYQTLESNTASMAIAARLGFEPWGRSLAVRLHAPRPA